MFTREFAILLVVIIHRSCANPVAVHVRPERMFQAEELMAAEMAGDTSTQRRAVCGKITYDPSDKLCCGGTVQSMWPSADMMWPKCCGTKVYDAGYNLCCRGVVHRKKEGKCCGTQVYDEQYYSCCHSSFEEKSWIC